MISTKQPQYGALSLCDILYVVQCFRNGVQYELKGRNEWRKAEERTKRLQEAGIAAARLTQEFDPVNLSPTEVRTVHDYYLHCYTVNFAGVLGYPRKQPDDPLG